jgi:hypothetical protein
MKVAPTERHLDVELADDALDLTERLRLGLPVLDGEDSPELTSGALAESCHG